MPALLRAINEGYRLHLRSAWRRFERAAADPRAAQQERLSLLLRNAQGTAFADAHGLASVRSLRDYQDAVPARDYDGLAPYVERMLQGEERVLTREAPRVFETSSGSTRASKFIPYTPAFLEDFGQGTGPWLYDLYTRRPGLRACSSYWSISPSAGTRSVTPGGTPVGFADDTEYFPRPVRRLLRQLLPVPSEVARLPDVDACRYATLRVLCADARLGFVSVWSPSFLTLLLEHGREHADRLADDVARGTLTLPGIDASLLPRACLSRPSKRLAAAVREAFPARGPLNLRALWPRLQLVSCWADAAAAVQVPPLRALLPVDVELQPKGLLATEGVISFPLLDRPGGVLALSAHLLEFAPHDDEECSQRPLPAHALELGERYQPILSTRGGLYRYRLGDVVEVVGRYRRAPLVRFVGRSDGVSDLAGEKLSPGHVHAAVAQAASRVRAELRFALLAPLGAGAEAGSPSYRLYAEGLEPAARDAFAAAFEDALSESHHYALCRRLGQLGPLSIQVVEHGWARFEAALVKRGVKAGNIKPTSLRRDLWWPEVFPS